MIERYLPRNGEHLDRRKQYRAWLEVEISADEACRVGEIPMKMWL